MRNRYLSWSTTALIIALSLILTPTISSAKSRSSRSRSSGSSYVLINSEAAIKAWNVKPKDDETTAALVKRVRKQIVDLLDKDRDKLDPDSSYWRLLAYLRELDWEKMPKSYKTWYLEKMPNLRLTDEQRAYYLKSIESKPIYKMSPKEVDLYLGYAQEKYPNLRDRVVHLARKNLGQPYKLYLLGEFPHEVYDSEPMYCLTNGDCVVFSEHTYAMALSKDWPQFYKMLQRIRYKDGEVGMMTRNHFTEADWDINNSWLVKDVTNDLGATTVTQYTEKIDRAKFFEKFGIGHDIPVQMLEDTYIPAEAVPSVLDKLQDGDFVNVARGIGNGVWIGHVGMIGHGKDGKVHFIHSTEPKVVEQPIMEYVEKNVKRNKERAKKGGAQFLGFKFLRLKEDAYESSGLAPKSGEVQTANVNPVTAENPAQ